MKELLDLLNKIPQKQSQKFLDLIVQSNLDLEKSREEHFQKMDLLNLELRHKLLNHQEKMDIMEKKAIEVEKEHQRKMESLRMELDFEVKKIESVFKEKEKQLELMTEVLKLTSGNKVEAIALMNSARGQRLDKSLTEALVTPSKQTEHVQSELNRHRDSLDAKALAAVKNVSFVNGITGSDIVNPEDLDYLGNKVYTTNIRRNHPDFASIDLVYKRRERDASLYEKRHGDVTNILFNRLKVQEFWQHKILKEIVDWDFELWEMATEGSKDWLRAKFGKTYNDQIKYLRNPGVAALYRDWCKEDILIHTTYKIAANDQELMDMFLHTVEDGKTPITFSIPNSYMDNIFLFDKLHIKLFEKFGYVLDEQSQALFDQIEIADDRHMHDENWSDIKKNLQTKTGHTVTFKVKGKVISFSGKGQYFKDVYTFEMVDYE